MQPKDIMKLQPSRQCGIWHKDKKTYRTEERLEIDPKKYSPLISCKGGKRKRIFSTNGARITRHTHVEKRIDTDLISFTKSN